MYKNLALIFVLLILFIADKVNCKDPEDFDPIVEISNGKLVGEIHLNSNGNKIWEFKGIQYGHVAKRFAESEQIIEKWKDAKIAKKFGPKCRQLNSLTMQVEGEEQCLFLNVFSRNISSDAKLKTMVFNHGGGFVEGSSQDYLPYHLLNENLVVVTINYRLGPLGFMNAGIKECSGNLALKDMVLALKWVQKNIQSFGGDPASVTIFGQSAGSAAVSFLILSPSAKGLFSRAILQSGANFAPWAFTHSPLDSVKKLAQKFDCPTLNPQYMVQCLQRIDSEILLASNQSDSFETYYDPDLVQITFPVSKETFITQNAFLTENPEDILAKNLQNRVPIMIGVNRFENQFYDPMSIFGSPDKIEMFNRNWQILFPKLYKFKKGLNQCVLVDQIWNVYFPTSKNKSIGIENFEEMTNLFTEYAIIPGVRRFARFFSKNQPVYLYRFTLKGDNSFSKFNRTEGQLLDPNHSDELFYLFDIPYSIKNERFVRDSKRIVKLWTLFVQNGEPTVMWGDKLKVWSKFDPEKPTWIDINVEISEIEEMGIFGNRMKFWDDFYDKIY